MKKIIENTWLYLEEVLATTSLISFVITGFLINLTFGFGAIAIAAAIGSKLIVKYKEKLYQ